MIDDSLLELLGGMPEEVKMQTQLSIGIARRINYLMVKKGLSRKRLAEELGRRPSEITKWLSGHHNFTISTLGRLSAYFGQPIISVASDDE